MFKCFLFLVVIITNDDRDDDNDQQIEPEKESKWSFFWNWIVSRIIIWKQNENEKNSRFERHNDIYPPLHKWIN